MTNLYKALLKAQKAMGAATKDASNPYFKSKYADYGAVLEAVKGPLNDNGIVLLQPHVFQDGRLFVKTVLAHADSGEEYESMTEVVCAKQNDPQALGSAITYARRYGLQSLPCLPTEDDDGNAASPPKTSKPVTEKVVDNSVAGTPGTLTNAAPGATATPARSAFRRLGTPLTNTKEEESVF